MVGGTEQISQRGIQRDKKKKAFFEVPSGVGGGTHRSWPGGRGGRAREERVGGAGWQFQTRGGLGLGCSKAREGLACLAVPQEGARAREESKGFGSGRCVIFRKLEGSS